MHLSQIKYYQHVRNAVLAAFAKPSQVRGKREEMRGLLQREKLSLHAVWQNKMTEVKKNMEK